jgi:hypothetical protein
MNLSNKTEIYRTKQKNIEQNRNLSRKSEFYRAKQKFYRATQNLSSNTRFIEPKHITLVVDVFILANVSISIFKIEYNFWIIWLIRDQQVTLISKSAWQNLVNGAALESSIGMLRLRKCDKMCRHIFYIRLMKCLNKFFADLEKKIPWMEYETFAKFKLLKFKNC